MSKTINKKIKSEPIREGFGRGLIKIGGDNHDVVALTADLRSSVRMTEFSKKYSERFIEVGIAEQNMAGIAAGLALSGRIPYIGSFASFQPMRNLDQIRTSICIMQAPVKIVSSHAGFSFAGDGIQIQALEDVGIMRTLPNMVVVVPADAEQAEQFAQDIANNNAPTYLRLGRAAAPLLSVHPLIHRDIYESPMLNKMQMLRRGGDGTILAMGYMVDKALRASQKLAEKGYHYAVANVHTVKPLDVKSIHRAVNTTGNLITVEEHQRAGGLGSAIAEKLTDYDLDYKHKIIAVEDEFGETAQTPEELYQQKGLTVENIVEAALAQQA